jgi:hypothetical protein
MQLGKRFSFLRNPTYEVAFVCCFWDCLLLVMVYKESWLNVTPSHLLAINL